MKFYILLIGLLSSLSTFSMETKGILELNVERTSGAIVGETYPAVLTLVPFETQMLTNDMLENKNFLDYFFVSRVLQIQQSENNADAVVIYLDLIVLKQFKNQDFKIWPLGARNIPVSFSIDKIQNTQLVIKDFITYDTQVTNESNFGLKEYAILVGIIILGFCIYLILKRRGVDKIQKINVAQELKISNGHKDYEWIYRNRKVLLESIDNSPEAKEKLLELTSLVEKYQFRKNWEKMDISELNSKKNKILESLKNGV